MKLNIMLINRKGKRKQLIGIYILLIIMVIACVILKIGINGARFTSGEAYNIYTDKDNMFQFKYPKDYTITPRDFNDKMVIKHVDYNSQDKKVYGYVQVWNLNEQLKEFLEEGKKNAVGNVNFKYYNIKDVDINENKGYLVDSDRQGNDNEFYKTKSYFFRQGQFVYVITLSSNEKNWNESTQEISDYMVKNFKFK